ncbi:hypothetical protein BHM03_00033006 [Ensete ventricosum]|nr:hypothetical protein BHM03_00033006 [Ensete ventricosum]
MCPLLTETADGDDDSDLAADRAAAEVIDTMAINIPKQVFPPIFEFASLNFCHSNPKFREASVTSLGVVSEGCFEMLKEKLEHVLHIVLGALKDQEQMVRGAASFALGQFAEHLQPEILSHYENVLPCILNALEDPSDEVKVTCVVAVAIGLYVCYQGFALDFSELREYTHGFFSNMAEILDDAFTQFVVIKVCNFDLYRSVRAVYIGPPGYQYADRLLSGSTVTIDRRQLILVVRLREKRGRRRRRGKEERRREEDLSPRHPRPRADDSSAGRKIEAIYFNCYTVNPYGSQCEVSQKNKGKFLSITYILSSDIPRIAEATLTLLREESSCQQVESDCDADDGDVDHDEVLMDAVSDLLPAFAKAMGSHFEPVFAKLFDPLMKFAILPLVPEVVNISAQVIASPAESEEVKNRIGMAISHLISVYGNQMQPVMAALAPAHANALAAYLSKR